MHKPSFMFAIGLPGPHGNEDEDSLNREDDDNNGDDVAMEAVCSIVHSLHQEGPSAVRDIRQFISSLDGLCEAYMGHDNAGIEDAAHDVYTALRSLIGD